MKTRKTIDLRRRQRPLILGDLQAFKRRSLGRGEIELRVLLTEKQQASIYEQLQRAPRFDTAKAPRKSFSAIQLEVRA